MKILVTAASKHGSTWEIAQAIRDGLAAEGVEADAVRMENVDSLRAYDGYVIGSAVYAGHWLAQARTFISDHAAELRGRPVWLFSSGPIGFPLRPAEGRAVDIKQVVEHIRVKEHRVFAGCLQKNRLTMAEKAIVMAVHAREGDYRNWDEIRAWAAGIAQTASRESMGGVQV